MLTLHIKKLHLFILGTTFVAGVAIFAFGRGWVRNYGGDVLAVIFLYSLLSIWMDSAVIKKMMIVFLFAVCVEGVPLVIGSSSNIFQQFFLGSTFDPIDILLYALALCGIGSIEYFYFSSARTFHKKWAFCTQ